MAGSARSRSARGGDGPPPADPTGSAGGRLLLTGLCFALGACNPFADPDPEVRVEVASAHFEFDEEIGFAVHNGLGREIEVDVCPDGNVNLELLQRVRGRWESRGGHCPIVAPRTLAPGERLSGSRPGHSAEGLYALSLAYLFAVSDDDVFGVSVPGLAHSRGFQITD